MSPAGFELTAETPAKTARSADSLASTIVNPAEFERPVDADLSELVALWSTLSTSDRMTILAIAQAAAGSNTQD